MFFSQFDIQHHSILFIVPRSTHLIFSNSLFDSSVYVEFVPSPNKNPHHPR